MAKKKEVTVVVEDPAYELGPLPRLAFEIPEAATILRVGRSNLLNLISEGRLRVVRIGGRVIVPRVALDDFLSGIEHDQSHSPKS